MSTNLAFTYEVMLLLALFGVLGFDPSLFPKGSVIVLVHNMWIQMLIIFVQDLQSLTRYNKCYVAKEFDRFLGNKWQYLGRKLMC